MMILNKVKEYCKDKQLIDIGDKILLGLSGGADSVCLLFMLMALREEYEISIFAIHVNHGIRGEEADRDEEFCRNLCAKENIPFRAEHVDIPALSKELGIGEEECGRNVRYEIFNKTLEELGYNKIAVAHHANDQVETVLFQLMRGSKLTGLAGIRPKNGNVIRPLLSVTRKDIEAYLDKINQPYVTDSTNMSLNYARNYIRNKLLPDTLDIHPRAYENIQKAADYVGRVADYMQKEAEKLYSMAVIENTAGLHLSIEILIPVLVAADAVIIEMVIYMAICRVAGKKKDITGEFVNSVASLMDKQTGKLVNLKYGIQVKRVYDKLILTVPDKSGQVDRKVLNCNNKIYTELISVDTGTAVEYIKDLGGFPKDNLTKFFDYDKIVRTHGSLVTELGICDRCAEPEDYMALYADGHGKSVFDILKDNKIEASERAGIQVAAIGREVLLIPYIRGSENYHIDNETKNILKVGFVSELNRTRLKKGD